MKVGKLLKEILKNIEYKKLLWTNPNPSASFSAQTIPLDLSGYDEVEVECAFSTTYVNSRFSGKSYINGTTTLTTISGDTNTRLGVRVVTVADNGVAFGAGIYNNASSRNDMVIPKKIYGIKHI